MTYFYEITATVADQNNVGYLVYILSNAKTVFEARCFKKR